MTIKPFNIEAEQIVLASIFVRPKAIRMIDLRVDEFGDRRHRLLYEVLLDMDMDGTPIEVVTVLDELEKRNILNDVGGQEYIASLFDAISTSASIRHYAEIVRDTNIRWTLFRLTDQIKKELRSKTETPEIINKITTTINYLPKMSLREGKLAQEIKEWVEDSQGWFNVIECDKALNIVTKRNKDNRRVIINRLVKEGVIERHPNKNGVFRKVDDELVEIKFKEKKADSLDIRLPLGAEQFVHIYPKSIICIAGSPDSGKTSLMLNIIKLNMRRWETLYFSSEMGADEINSRLKNFRHDDGSPMSIDEWNFQAFERSGNFHDVIAPDDLNLIDFLEVGDNFYLIGNMLSKIHKKLRNGVAIIAIQKDPQADYGRGGSFSLEKPKLYMTLDNEYPFHILRIKKGKNWKDPEVNPNGMMRKFKIVGGAILFPADHWEREERKERKERRRKW
jgi:hypothetical protein